jgi:hypothetical protein
MILKELDPFTGSEPFEHAGRRAEEQMAFYLRREFGEHTDVFVINGLRLERKGDAAQIDHLLVHRNGFVIIESKSVTTEVAIDAKGDWSRLVDGTWRGMPSPINQAKLQTVLLKAVLDDFAPSALGKIFGMEKLQMRFGGLTYDAFAAVSDNGIINWPEQNKYDTICKADGICSLIKEKLKGYSARSGVLAHSKSLMYAVTEDSLIRYSLASMRKVAEHLVASHKPALAKNPSKPVRPHTTSNILVLPENTPPQPTFASTQACRDCAAKLSPRVMDFCRSNPNRFNGSLYCMNCQRKY